MPPNAIYSPRSCIQILGICFSASQIKMEKESFHFDVTRFSGGPATRATWAVALVVVQQGPLSSLSFWPSLFSFWPRNQASLYQNLVVLVVALVSAKIWVRP